MKALSEAVGKGPTYVFAFLSDRRVPDELPEGVRHKMASVLGVQEEQLRGPRARAAATNNVLSSYQPGHNVASLITQAPPLPLLGRAQAANGDVLAWNDGAVLGYVPSDPALASVNEAYAVEVAGSSMVPRLNAGDVVLVNPVRPPLPGDVVIVQDHDGQAWIKELVSASNKGAMLRQYSPERDFLVENATIRAIHKVVSIRLR